MWYNYFHKPSAVIVIVGKRVETRLHFHFGTKTGSITVIIKETEVIQYQLKITDLCINFESHNFPSTTCSLTYLPLFRP